MGRLLPSCPHYPCAMACAMAFHPATIPASGTRQLAIQRAIPAAPVRAGFVDHVGFQGFGVRGLASCPSCHSGVNGCMWLFILLSLMPLWCEWLCVTILPPDHCGVIPRHCRVSPSHVGKRAHGTVAVGARRRQSCRTVPHQLAHAAGQLPVSDQPLNLSALLQRVAQVLARTERKQGVCFVWKGRSIFWWEKAEQGQGMAEHVVEGILRKAWIQGMDAKSGVDARCG
eukprot:362776-Chlamydomonas_euryale.AAC.3